MLPDLEQLIQLQALDLQIRDLTRQRDDIPRQTESLELEISKSDKNLKALQETLENLRKERRRLEGDVDSARARLSRYKEQLMAVKTNKEYTAMQHEIEGCGKEITSKEDEVLAIMEKMEAQEKAIKDGQGGFAARQNEVHRQQQEQHRQAQSLDRQIDVLQAERGRLLGGISSSSLVLYRRIADARKGVALAEVRDQSCQLCHVRLRPQMFNEIRKNECIVTCESCNRILYYQVSFPG